VETGFRKKIMLHSSMLGMTMIEKTFAAIVAVFCLVAPALADDETPDTDHGRYSFSKVADGLLRLDMQTGEVSICSQRKRRAEKGAHRA
jgi:hypothetical protein